MSLAELQIPPGIRRNGTRYQSKGRWYDATLVRWHEGEMRAIGGWQRWGTANPEGVTRGGLAWTDNSGNRWIIFGTATTCYALDDDAGLTDISPSLTAGQVDASVTGGYGEALYGAGQYGTQRADIGVITLATSWSHDTFGEIPIACSSADGKVWEWDLNTSNNLTQVTNSPTSCLGILTTPERFIFALGAGGDPRRVEWCDREDRTVWTAAATNQAGGFNLETDGELRQGIDARAETLLLTSTDAWAARYIGYPDVYEFVRVGTGCGSSGQMTGVRANDFVAWMGANAFYRYSGGIIQEIPCDVHDYVFANMDKLQQSKTYGWHNHDWSEITWLYASGSEGEVDSYVTWNYSENTWSLGTMPVTTMIRRGVFRTPIGIQTSVEFVTNGAFDADTEWTKGAGWTIASGVATHGGGGTSDPGANWASGVWATGPSVWETGVWVGGGGAESDLSQDIPALVAGISYEVTFTVSSRTAGSVTPWIGDTAGTSRSTDATFTESITYAGTGAETFLLRGSSDFDGSIDNVSIKTASGIYQHEIGASFGGVLPYAKSGPVELGAGDARMNVTHLYADESEDGASTLTFETREYPNGSTVSWGPYTTDTPTSVRFSGREAMLTVEPIQPANWRFGVQRIEVKPGGKR